LSICRWRRRREFRDSARVQTLDVMDEDRRPGVNGSESWKLHRLVDALLEAGATGRPVRVDAGTP
jgi:hypothetical protein